MGKRLRVTTSTYAGGVVMPELAKVLQDCGKHLHTEILEVNPH